MRWRNTRTQMAMEYPLATGISLWSIIMGTLALYGITPSHTISQLPESQATAWGIGVVAASITTFWGLFVSRKVLTVTRGMFLHTMTITVYACSIFAEAGVMRGGAVASFLLIVAAVIAREGFILRRRALAGVRGAQ